mmetsp:Transcript_99486/g.276850  ORF Transcript_99486/g.276850 Transcript_99486/m.276850 type:complete len:285 (-) Transcript_99486:3-857(-)
MAAGVQLLAVPHRDGLVVVAVHEQDGRAHLLQRLSGVPSLEREVSNGSRMADGELPQGGIRRLQDERGRGLPLAAHPLGQRGGGPSADGSAVNHDLTRGNPQHPHGKHQGGASHDINRVFRCRAWCDAVPGILGHEEVRRPRARVVLRLLRHVANVAPVPVQVYHRELRGPQAEAHSLPLDAEHRDHALVAHHGVVEGSGAAHRRDPQQFGDVARITVDGLAHEGRAADGVRRLLLRSRENQAVQRRVALDPREHGHASGGSERAAARQRSECPRPALLEGETA